MEIKNVYYNSNEGKNTISISISRSFLFPEIFFLFIVLLLPGCNKDFEPPGPFIPINNPDQISGIDNLGSGYDVFERFADASKEKAPILDYRKLNKYALIEFKTLEHSSFHTTSGSCISEYSNSLSVSVGLSGSYMFFSGSIKTNFSSKRYSYDSYSFATYHSMINKYQLRLPTDWDANALKPYMTDQTTWLPALGSIMFIAPELQHPIPGMW